MTPTPLASARRAPPPPPPPAAPPPPPPPPLSHPTSSPQEEQHFLRVLCQDMLISADEARPGPRGVDETTRQVERAAVGVRPTAGRPLSELALHGSRGQFVIPDHVKPNWMRREVTDGETPVGGPDYYRVVVAGAPYHAAVEADDRSVHHPVVEVPADYGREKGVGAFRGGQTLMSMLHNLMTTSGDAPSA